MLNLLVLLLLLWKVCLGTQSPTDTANQLALPVDYNRHLRPSHKGPPDLVQVGIHIYSIGPISEAEMTMTLDMYFRTQWYDDRLQETVDYLLKNDKILAQKQKAALNKNNTNDLHLEAITFGGEVNNSFAMNSTNVVTLGQEYAEAIWTPDLYFPDAIEILRPGKGLISDSMVLALYEDCRLFQSMRLQVKARCKMALTLFPMDIQRCDVCVESYQYHTGDVKIDFWAGKVVLDGKRLEKYGTANFYIDYDNFWNTTIERTSFDYNYVTLCLGVKLVRKLSIYIITMYLPSISLVALSWVGFWIDKRAIPARASLSITTILAEITLITGTANQFPGIADLKMADLYLIINFFFVFASLIEFAMISYEPPVRAPNARKTLNFAKTIFKPRAPSSVGIPLNQIKDENKDQSSQRPSRVKKVNDHLVHITETKIMADLMTSPSVTSPIMTSTNVMSGGFSNDQSNSSESKSLLNYFSKPRTIRLQETPIEEVVNTNDFSHVQNRGAKKSKRNAGDLGNKGRGKLCWIINLDSFSKDNADEVSKWLFPLCFTIWNLAYFGVGLTVAGRIPFLSFS